MRKLVGSLCAVGACLALIAAGCGSDDSGGGDSGKVSSAVAAKAQKALDQLNTTVLSKGPYGEKPAPASSIELSSKELADIKAKNPTAAIVLHYGGNDWSTAQVD